MVNSIEQIIIQKQMGIETSEPGLQCILALQE